MKEFISNLADNLADSLSPDDTPTCTLECFNHTDLNLNFVETSPRDPQDVAVGPGQENNIYVFDSKGGDIFVTACTNFVAALICSSGHHVADGGTLHSKFIIENREDTKIRCIIFSEGQHHGGGIDIGQEGEIYVPATGFCKVILCHETAKQVEATSPAIPWDGKESITRKVTATKVNGTLKVSVS